MAVAIETIRGIQERTDRPTDKVLAFNTKLYQALGFEPDSLEMGVQVLLPREVLESAENMVIYGAEVAERVVNYWASIGYKPDPEVLLNGLVDFAINAGNTLKNAMPELDSVEIDERMKELGIRIRGTVIDSEGRRRNLRTDRDAFATRYMRALQNT